MALLFTEGHSIPCVAVISCVSYWLVGYALAYGRGDAVLGYSYFAGQGLPADKMAHWFFQFGFAATAATIVSGAVAERCNYIAYITYSVVISGRPTRLLSARHILTAELIHGPGLCTLGNTTFRRVDLVPSSGQGMETVCWVPY
jgi:hypothetical protein